MKLLLKRLLLKLGYRVDGIRYVPIQLLEPDHLRPLELKDAVAARMLDVGNSLLFMQIGAFDGITVDPLYPYIDRLGWRGVLIEPQPEAARKLRELYGANDRITVVEAAVDAVAGWRTLFTVESACAPDWAGGMASFQKDHLLKHSSMIPGLEAMLREIEVECVTFDWLFERFTVDRLDLLQIDAEGADALILSLFPFDRVKPAIIHWEIKNLSKSQREHCLGRLLEYGYRFSPSGEEDMLAVLS